MQHLSFYATNSNSFHYGHRMCPFLAVGLLNLVLLQKTHATTILKRIGRIYVRTFQMNEKTIIYKSHIQDWSEYEFSQMCQTLPAWRVEKARHFLKKEDTHTSLLASWMLEYLIGFQEITYTSYGKPYVADRHVYFSVAHSDGMVVVALSNEEVGIDCERLQLQTQASIVSLFHPNEAMRVEKQTEPFSSIWTGKEAYGKWLGVGLNYDLHVMDVKENDVFWKEKKLPLTMTKIVCEQWMIAVCARHINDAQCIDFKGSVLHASEFSRGSCRE